MSVWSSSFPLDDYKEQVEKIAPSKSLQCPDDYLVGDLSISCGPLVRFLAYDEENKGNYRGSILIVVRNLNDKPHKLSYELSSKASGDFNSEIIYQEEDYTFIRYAMEFKLTDTEQEVKYSLNGTNLPHFKFVVPSSTQSMNVMSYSCNGFSLGVDTTEFKGSLWLDVLRKHEKFPYHVMIGGGDQIYADSIKITSKELERWAKHRHLYSGKGLSDTMVNSFKTYYLNHYVKWFGKGFWEGPNGKTIQVCYPIALASIPQVNIFDDHDIIDGFGSYSDPTMRQEIFQGVGQYAFRYYMLFQHHTPYKENINLERSFIGGHSIGPYIKEQSRSVYAKLGSQIAFLGLDCRTERTKKQVVSPETYKIVFDRLETEVKSSNTKIKHLYVLLGVPIMYPRMVWVEKLMESVLAKPLKFLARHGIINGSLVNEFDGEIELLDDLNDHWCAKHHKSERNWLLNKLINFGKSNDIRITILSGDVHLCCISRLSTNEIKDAERDPNFIINLISSAIVNVPPPQGMATFMKKRAISHHFTDKIKEDMIPIFESQEGDNDLFMARRNYSDLIPIENLSDEQRLTMYGSEQPSDNEFIPGESTQLQRAKVDKVKHSETNGKVGYKYCNDSVVVTLHVEKEREDTNSTTNAFELFIPPLVPKSS